MEKLKGNIMSGWNKPGESVHYILTINGTDEFLTRAETIDGAKKQREVFKDIIKIMEPIVITKVTTTKVFELLDD